METQELGHTGNNAKEKGNSHSSEITVKSGRIDGTPLMWRWEKENGWSFGITGYRVSEWYKTEKDMLKKANEKDWETIMGITGAMIDATLKLHNLIK